MARKYIIRTAIFLICLGIFLKCEFAKDKKHPLYLMNNSEIPVCYYLAWGDAVSTTVYPDTLLPEDNVFQDEVVRPKKMGIMYAIFHTWEEAFRLLPADTLSIFILDAKKLNTYTWKDVRSSYTVLQRYDLSIRDLQNLNFILTYPPTREMKLIKGYSPQKADKF